MPENAEKASKYLKAFMPTVHRVPACINDCTTFPDADAVDEPCCDICDPPEPIFHNGKPRKSLQEIPVKDVVTRQLACKPIAEQLSMPWPLVEDSRYMHGFTGEPLHTGAPNIADLGTSAECRAKYL